jgi:hypothetical protein
VQLAVARNLIVSYADINLRAWSCPRWASQAKHFFRPKLVYGVSVEQLARLTMHRYVPEMGLLIVGSQSLCYADLLYVVWYGIVCGV